MFVYFVVSKGSSRMPALLANVAGSAPGIAAHRHPRGLQRAVR